MRAQFVRGADPRKIMDLGINYFIQNRNLKSSSDDYGFDSVDRAINISLEEKLGKNDFFRLCYVFNNSAWINNSPPIEEKKIERWINAKIKNVDKEFLNIHDEEYEYGMLSIFRINEGLLIDCSVDNVEFRHFWIADYNVTDFLFKKMPELFKKDLTGRESWKNLES
jgi:hypothetical protein